MPAREGVRGVLRTGPAAAAAPQRQLQPGQGLHHETHHQLPAHEKTSKYGLVSVVGVDPSVFHQFCPKCEVKCVHCFITLKLYLQF